MKRFTYAERDYTFGQMMLTLRTNIGLTQAGLGERLGVSRRAVAEWEAGLSYPKAERLKEFITLCVRTSAFHAGRDEEDIRALWKAAHRKVLLDERWLHDLLASPRPIPLFPQAETQDHPTDLEPASIPRVDWMGALDTSHFAGREVEVAELTQWILEERCRLVTLVGMGGIGKSMLASFLGLRLAPHFEAMLWRSVRLPARNWSPTASPSSPRRRPQSSPPRSSSASRSCFRACRPGAACWCSTTWRRCCKAGTARGTT